VLESAAGSASSIGDALGGMLNGVTIEGVPIGLVVKVLSCFRFPAAPNTNVKTGASLGGQITTAPALAANADGRLEAFARGTDSALWHIWQGPDRGAGRRGRASADSSRAPPRARS
jgi:hypothetical protein